MRATIICIGNRFVAGDAAGPAVYDRLLQDDLPDGVELVDGGLQGLNLLPLLEQGGRVVFVDAVDGFASQGSVVVLDEAALASGGGQTHFDHGAGIGYLLGIMPQVCEGELPEEIALVGIEGACTLPLIEEAARLTVEVALNGIRERG